MTRLAAYLVLVLALCVHTRAAGQHQQSASFQLEESEWREITEGTSYTETYRSKESRENARRNTPALGLSRADFAWLKYVFYVLIAAVLILVLRRLFRSMDQNPAVSSPVKTEIMTVEEAEKRIHEADLNAMLERALHERDHRLALRLRFLILIRMLSEKGVISWAKEKTNWQYYAEIRDRLAADQFRELVKQFERGWYGDHPVDEHQYKAMIPAFEGLQKWAAQ